MKVAHQEQTLQMLEERVMPLAVMLHGFMSAVVVAVLAQ
jgi:hypothetical protein